MEVFLKELEQKLKFKKKGAQKGNIFEEEEAMSADQNTA